jgi:hypothetical protein
MNRKFFLVSFLPAAASSHFAWVLRIPRAGPAHLTLSSEKPGGHLASDKDGAEMMT